MSRLTLHIIGLILAAAISGCRVSDRQLANTRAADYEVYSAILDSSYVWREGVSDSILFPFIVDSTSSGNTIDSLPGGTVPLSLGRRFDLSTGREIRIEPLTHLRDQIHPRELEGIELDSLVGRFNQMNLIRLAMDSSLFASSIRAKLISRREMKTLLHDGWIRFYQKFPKSHGIVLFSRVAFNDSLTQAFLYWEQLRADFSGEGAYLILRRDPARVWKIVFRYTRWVS